MTPNIVPASFSPAPEKYERQASQELRNRQAQLAQGYALSQVSRLEIQQHRAAYKRDAAWQNASPAEMAEALRVAKTARTLMLQDISVWAGNLDEDEMQSALPSVWAEYVQKVWKPTVDLAVKETPADEPESTPDLGEAEPIQVIFRPTIPEDAPQSVVVAPDQLTLGELLAKIEAKK
jgi:hypothetical protein